MFERLRAFCGGHPLTIGSGYRTPAWNRKQGGATKSQHRQGRAIDLYPPRGMMIEEFHAKVRMFARMEPLVGALGLYRWGIHLDIRPRKSGGWSSGTRSQPGRRCTIGARDARRLQRQTPPATGD